MRDHRRAFTLLELLLVIAIVSLLLSIVIPGLAQARLSSKATACASNLRQLGIATAGYWSENRGFLPGHHTADANPTIVWPTRLREYTEGSVSAFWCPQAAPEFRWEPQFLDNGQPEEYGYRAGERRIRSRTGFSYGYNDWGVREFVTPHLGLGAIVGSDLYGEVNESKVAFPFDMITLADSKSDFSWDTAIDPSNFDTLERPSTRHFGGSEVLWLDGHVAIRRQVDLVAETLKARASWNNDHQPHEDLWKRE